MAELESKILDRAPASINKEEEVPKLKTPVKTYVEWALFFAGMIGLTVAGLYAWLNIL